MPDKAFVSARLKCLIINCQGSPKAVRGHLEVALTVLLYAVETLEGQAGKWLQRKLGFNIVHIVGGIWSGMIQGTTSV